VAAFDWNNVEAEFSLHIATCREAFVNRPRRKREDAIALMAAYYTEHKADLPPTIASSREHIIARLIAGENVGDVFAAVVRDQPGSTKLSA